MSRSTSPRNEYILDVGSGGGGTDIDDDDASGSGLEFTNYAPSASAAAPASLSGQKMSSKVGGTGGGSGAAPSGGYKQVTPPAYSPAATAMPLPSSAGVHQAINEEAAGGKQTMWSLGFYQRYFDVDLAQVLKRMSLSVLPLTSFLDVYRDGPDIYGPFWITTTVVFQVFVTRSIQKSLDAYMHEQPFTYEFDVLPGAAMALYIYTFAWPLVLWSVMKYCLRFPADFLDLVGMFGYSLTVWIAALIFVMIPGQEVQYITCVVALLVNVAFVLRNYPSMFAGSGQEPTFSLRTKQLSAGTVAVMLAIASKVALACMVKFWFLA